MSIWGAGPRIGWPTFLYLAGAIAATLAWPSLFSFQLAPRGYLTVAGCTLLALTVPLYALTVRAIAQAHDADRLVTTGAYAICRHPLYSQWILLVLPAVALLLDSWLVLGASGVMYAITRAAVRREERYLEDRFGDEYRDYKQRVNAIFPTLWRR